jgi:LmbE family N-acetylglucosaminyl deacetylase
MMKLELSEEKGRPLRVLCLGAHSDDIEVGCGGTVLRLLAERPAVEILWVVLGATGEREKEARGSAAVFLEKATSKEVLVGGFRDSFFPYVGGEVKEYFETLKRKANPDLILTHYRHDLHQDHRLVSELTWNTFRDHLILEYEIVKYDGDLGIPNCYVHLPERICREKVENLMRCFGSQREKRWFTEDTFYGILRLRGVESNAPERCAEGFHCRKAVL